MKEEPEIYRHGQMLNYSCSIAAGTSICQAPWKQPAPERQHLSDELDRLVSDKFVRVVQRLVGDWVKLLVAHEQKLATEPLDWRRIRALLPLIEAVLADPVPPSGSPQEENAIRHQSRLDSIRRFAEAWMPTWAETKHLFATGMHLRPEFIVVDAPDSDTRDFCQGTLDALAILTDLQRCAMDARSTGEAAINRLLNAHARLKTWLLLNRQALVPKIRQHMTTIDDLKAVADADRRDPWGAIGLHQSEPLSRAITKIAYLDEMLRGVNAVTVPALAPAVKPLAAPVPPPPALTHRLPQLAAKPEVVEPSVAPKLNGPHKDIKNHWWVDGELRVLQLNNKRILMLRQLYEQPQAIDSQSAVEWGVIYRDELNNISATASRAKELAVDLGLDWTVAIRSVNDNRPDKVRIFIHRKAIVQEKQEASANARAKPKAKASKPPKRTR